MSSYVLFERFSKRDKNREKEGKEGKVGKAGEEREEEKGRDAYIHSSNKYASNVSHQELTGESITTSGVTVLALDGRDSTRLDGYAKMSSIHQPNKARALHIRAIESTSASGHPQKAKDHQQKESRDNSKSGGDEKARALHIRAVESTNASGHPPKAKDHQQKESKDNSKSSGNDKARALHIRAVESTSASGHPQKAKDHQQKESRDNSKSGGDEKARALHIRAVESTNARGHQPKTKNHQQKESRENSKSGGDDKARALHIRAVELSKASGHPQKARDHQQKESRDNSKSGGDEKARALHIRAVESTNARGHQPKTKDHQQKESRENSKSGGDEEDNALHIRAVESTNASGHPPKAKDHQQKESRDNSKSGGDEKVDVYMDSPPIYCKQVHGADIWLIDKDGGSRVFTANDYRNSRKNENIKLQQKFSKDAFNRLDLYGKKSDTSDKKNNAAKRDFQTSHANTSDGNTGSVNTGNGNTGGGNTGNGNTGGGNTGNGNTGGGNTGNGNTGGGNTGSGNTGGGMIAKKKEWQQKASLTVGGGEHMPLGYRQKSTQHADNSTQSQENNRSESGKENLQSSWVVADGMVTNKRHCALAIRTADCLPIMMWQLDARKGASPVIAALHGGWRSLYGGIIQNAFSVIERTYQLSGASFAALIAPAISDRAYEVDERFIQTVSNGMGGMMHVEKFAKPIENKQSKWWFDLKDWANSILLSCGVLQKNIQLLNVCTYHDEEYFSYRRNQQTGRNISIIQFF